MDLSSGPLVSVILPSYNRTDVLARALESIVKQSLQNIEIIVVDDGSTENLLDLLKAYTDPRLRVIRLYNNQGPAAARNVGIKASKGKMVAFLDSDDEWLPTKLEEQIVHFKKSKKRNPNIFASFTGFYLYKINGHIETRTFRNEKQWRNYFLEGCLIGPGSTLLVDRRVYGKIGFYDESFQRFEDWDWLLRFSQTFDLVSFEKPLSNVHQHEAPQYQVVFPLVRKIYKKHMKSLSLLEKRRFFSACQIELGYSCVRKNLKKALGHFLLGVVLNPYLLKRFGRGISHFFKKG